MPKHIVQTLRDLRDSYITTRPIPELVNACLKQTRGECCSNSKKSQCTTRTESIPIDLWLCPEFAELEADEIRERVALALIGIEEKLIPQNIKMNREGFNEWN